MMHFSQESLQQLSDISKTKPLTEDSFDLANNGELRINDSADGFSPDQVADSSTLKLRGQAFDPSSSGSHFLNFIFWTASWSWA